MTASVDERVEAAAAHAWPARIVEPIGPWLARASDRFTQRANSVAVLGRSPVDLDACIDHCELRYAHWQLPVRFQIADTERTSEVRHALAQRGFRPGPGVVVLTRDLVEAGPSPDDGLRLMDEPSRGWFDLWWSVDGRGPDLRPVAAELLDRVPEPRAFALAVRDDRPAGVGLGVVVGSLAGFFCAATRADVRRHGVGSEVARGLSQWASALGATTAFVQVEASNVASRRMSTEQGFVPIYTYRYWQRP